MAYGYARASGKPTACITTSGPGTINLLTGISLAYKGRAPVLVIAGDVARDYMYRDGNQAFESGRAVQARNVYGLAGQQDRAYPRDAP